MLQRDVYCLCSVQFKMVPTRSGKPVRAPPCLSNVYPVLPLKRVPMLPFQVRSSSTSSLYASLLRPIDGVMSLALCPKTVSQVPQHFRSSERQATVRVALPANQSGRSFFRDSGIFYKDAYYFNEIRNKKAQRKKFEALYSLIRARISL